MGRWRAPQKPGSAYITAAGFDQLQRELDALWVRRREVVKALAAAAAEGDRSENAEYIYRKKELGGLDYRIRYLQKRLPNLTIVRSDARRSGIYFGATVTVEDDAGGTALYTIVGPDETDAGKGRISIDSPLARALLGKNIDDEVERPDKRLLTIIAIDYAALD
ncbi:MAG: GreA/GreB family elongation factor [Pseudomonadota bacterium]